MIFTFDKISKKWRILLLAICTIGTLTIFIYQKGVKALPDAEFTSKR